MCMCMCMCMCVCVYAYVYVYMYVYVYVYVCMRVPICACLYEIYSIYCLSTECIYGCLEFTVSEVTSGSHTEIFTPEVRLGPSDGTRACICAYIRAAEHRTHTYMRNKHICVYKRSTTRTSKCMPTYYTMYAFAYSYQRSHIV